MKKSGVPVPAVVDLVYTDSSPNYCVKQESLGIYGNFIFIKMDFLLGIFCIFGFYMQGHPKEYAIKLCHLQTVVKICAVTGDILQ